MFRHPPLLMGKSVVGREPAPSMALVLPIHRTVPATQLMPPAVLAYLTVVLIIVRRWPTLAARDPDLTTPPDVPLRMILHVSRVTSKAVEPVANWILTVLAPFP